MNFIDLQSASDEISSLAERAQDDAVFLKDDQNLVGVVLSYKALQQILERGSGKADPDEVARLHEDVMERYAESFRILSKAEAAERLS